MDVTETRFVALQIYSHDEHYGVDRPAAVVLRCDGEFNRKVLRATQLMESEGYLKVGISLKPADVAWLARVGYSSENGLRAIPGERPGDTDWMPADAPVTALGEVMELDVDGTVADYDEHLLYTSDSEPITGTPLVFLERMDEQTLKPRADAPIHFSFLGNTTNESCSSLLFKVEDAFEFLKNKPQEEELAGQQLASFMFKAPGDGPQPSAPGQVAVTLYEVEGEKLTREQVITVDSGLTAEQLDDKYNQDGGGEHPVFTRQGWRHEVGERNTVSGYWDWVESQVDTEHDALQVESHRPRERATA